ncbi:MAG: hypothetical protein PW734_02250 [Verrucomicrobium sp.]|nr:hypothetical protein [Verrucomicrobium sp.]
MAKPDSQTRIDLSGVLQEAAAKASPAPETDRPSLSSIATMARIHQEKQQRHPSPEGPLYDDLKTGAIVFRSSLAHLENQRRRLAQEGRLDTPAARAAAEERKENLSRTALDTLLRRGIPSTLFLNALRETGADVATLHHFNEGIRKHEPAILRRIQLEPVRDAGRAAPAMENGHKAIERNGRLH